jgi:hypothetical protein
MKRIGDSLELSASDLVGYLNCRHLSSLDGAVAAGALSKPKLWDPLLQILWERGLIHEQKYVEHLTNAGLEVVRIGGVDVTDEAIFETLDAMRKGSHAIVQGALRLRAGSAAPTFFAAWRSRAQSAIGRMRRSTQSLPAKQEREPYSSFVSTPIY